MAPSTKVDSGTDASTHLYLERKKVMDILDMLYSKIVTPAKEKLKNELFEGMDRCARVLVVTKRIGEMLNLFDSATYTDILNRYANEHFEATKGMNHDQLLEYMAEGGKKNEF